MKSIFWEVIPAKDIKDTLWDELDDTKIKINLDVFFMELHLLMAILVCMKNEDHF